jgi:hypothetical protein
MVFYPPHTRINPLSLIMEYRETIQRAQELAQELLAAIEQALQGLQRLLEATWEAIVAFMDSTLSLIVSSVVFIVSTVYDARKRRYILSLDRRGRLRKTRKNDVFY